MTSTRWLNSEWMVVCLCAVFLGLLTPFKMRAEREERPPEYLMAALPSVLHKSITSLMFPLALTPSAGRRRRVEMPEHSWDDEFNSLMSTTVRRWQSWGVRGQPDGTLHNKGTTEGKKWAQRHKNMTKGTNKTEMRIGGRRVDGRKRVQLSLTLMCFSVYQLILTSVIEQRNCSHAARPQFTPTSQSCSKKTWHFEPGCSSAGRADCSSVAHSLFLFASSVQRRLFI